MLLILDANRVFFKEIHALLKLKDTNIDDEIRAL